MGTDDDDCKCVSKVRKEREKALTVVGSHPLLHSSSPTAIIYRSEAILLRLSNDNDVDASELMFLYVLEARHEGQSEREMGKFVRLSLFFSSPYEETNKV